MAKSRVSITVATENVERFTPLYTITNSMDNLRFGKEDCFHVLVFYTGYFIKEIENIFPRVSVRHRNTRGSLEELEIAWKALVPTSISRSPKLPLVFL